MAKEEQAQTIEVQAWLDKATVALGYEVDQAMDIAARGNAMLVQIDAVTGRMKIAEVELDKLAKGLDALGYRVDGGDEGVTIVDKALFALAGLSDSREEYAGQIAKLGNAILELDMRGSDDGGACAVAEIRLRELAPLKAENEKLAKALTKAKGEVSVARASLPPKPRKIGAIDTPATTKELRDYLAGDVELAFSDGRQELPGLAPVRVTGFAAWAPRNHGFLLRTHVVLKGPAPGRSYDIAGVGLLVDGKQVAWCDLANPVTVPGGGQMQLRDSILFA